MSDPILIGLCGRAGTGKTSTADQIVPDQQVRIDADLQETWDHLYLAMPLYAMSTIRRRISGAMQDDRQKYELHKVLMEVLGSNPLWGAPPYQDFVDLVYNIHGLPISTSGKPREFLRTAGRMCRDLREDCFIHWVNEKSRQRFINVNPEHQAFFLVSDVRFPNEAAAFSGENKVLIKFTASDEVRHSRIEKRDGMIMSWDELDNHSSEVAVDNIDPEHIDYTINTDNLSLPEQAEATISAIRTILRNR